MARSSQPARLRVEYRAARALSALPPRAQIRLSRRPPVHLDGQTLEPELQLSLSVLERRGALPLERYSPVEARQLVRKQSAVASGPPILVESVQELRVAGGAGPLRARHYAPGEHGGPHPLLVFFHGGGFVVGDLDTHDGACRLLCKHTGAHVLSVDYRLAPEHPFPAAVDDAVAALGWALEHAGELGADPARVAVGGDSAGGNLAAVSALAVVRAGGPRPILQLLMYPVTDFAEASRSHELFEEGFFLSRAQMDWFAANYAAQADPLDPRLSVVRDENLADAPPALVFTAGFDPLRDDGEAYARALRAAGAVVAQRRFDGLIHGFANMAGISRVSRDALIEIAGATRALLAILPAAVPENAERHGSTL
jgi:acetyl esterase